MAVGYILPGPLSLRVGRDFNITTRQGAPVISPLLPRYGTRTDGSPNKNNKQHNGYLTLSYIDDFYKRIIVIPAEINLGTFSTEQVVSVTVWNAFFNPVICLRVTVTGDDNITLRGAVMPLTFRQLGTAVWQITIPAAGAASLDCVIIWEFSGLNPVTFRLTGERSNSWSLSPEWADGITETLEWKTDVLTSRSGAEQRIARRLAPRRTFEFTVTASGTERQRLEQQIWQNGGNAWLIPVWTDATRLAEDVAAGATSLMLNTAGRDFDASGRVTVSDGRSSEGVQVDSVQPQQLVLTRPLGSGWPAGSQVTPQRNSVLTDPPVISRLSDGVVRAQMRFRVTDGQPVVVGHGMTEYRGHPVLGVNSCWSEDLTAEYVRLMHEVDNGSGRPSVTDVAGRPFCVQSHRFVLYGQSEQAALRQLLGWLRGRQRPLWVGSQSSDFYPVAGAGGASVDVQGNGFSANGPAAGRQDIRIELTGDRVYCCRIIAAAELNGDTERLALDSELPPCERAEIMKISFMTLCRLNSDAVAWEHKTDADGVAIVDVNFTEVRDELE